MRVMRRRRRRGRKGTAKNLPHKRRSLGKTSPKSRLQPVVATNSSDMILNARANEILPVFFLSIFYLLMI